MIWARSSDSAAASTTTRLHDRTPQRSWARKLHCAHRAEYPRARLDLSQEELQQWRVEVQDEVERPSTRPPVEAPVRSAQPGRAMSTTGRPRVGGEVGRRGVPLVHHNDESPRHADISFFAHALLRMDMRVQINAGKFQKLPHELFLSRPILATWPMGRTPQQRLELHKAERTRQPGDVFNPTAAGG